MKTFDCFLFFNELDLLEIRFNILNDFVDYFVIVEASQTFQGENKEFIFDRYEHMIKILESISKDDLKAVADNILEKNKNQDGITILK